MGAYMEGIVILLAINCIAALGLSLLTGFIGIFSIGHAGYMAIGAYAAAVLTTEYGIHWLPSLCFAGIVSMIVAWLIGIPTLKLSGDYYTIASLGLGEAIRLIIENGGSLTRGARGYPGIDNFTTLPVALGCFLVLGVLMACLVKSSYGRAFKACRDDRLAASLIGFKTSYYRILGLAISAFYCGVAGGLMAGFMSFIQPAMFDGGKSSELTAIVVFGGMGSLSGTLLGSVVITLVTEIFRPISQYRMLIYGLALLLVIILRPDGIVGQREILPLSKVKALFTPRSRAGGTGEA